ncbi:MAG: hypothetical protein F6J86_23445 [Symploca sp. SIO1B1]|nr:hypothetical protein [Symploca sp. SIO2D2]NER96765.1 hypothetical protein [Symploca sp. SIO1B1]
MDGIGVAVVEWLIKVVQAYIYGGLVFSLVFHLFGIGKIDPDARGWKNIGFRLVIIPGLCVFWPMFAVRWFRGKRTPVERNAHRIAAAQTPNP